MTALIESDGRGGYFAGKRTAAWNAPSSGSFHLSPLCVPSRAYANSYYTARPKAQERDWSGGAEETPLGWAFDGDVDEVRLACLHYGFDMTQILEYEEVCAPAAAYLLHRVGAVVDGRRFVMCATSFGFIY